MRNFFESFVCLCLVFVFGRMVFAGENLVITFLSLEIVLSAIMISVVFNTKGRFNKLADDLKQAELIEVYILELQGQIHLLSKVRYWYVGPLLIGMAGLHIERIYHFLRIGISVVLPIVMLLVLIFLAIYLVYSNEVKLVRELEEEVKLLKRIQIK